ncbi:helix-turn-helix transcriptional regulator [Mucilaginibacter sp.]|uniref:helix-turn-helix domain-containing protein n=1 Tax=Mucilaginibacter sp. TaxID=1882438 RepID=UPI00261EF05F|nr:helix-turn-helix transcriptional regulator [Mucilaginibacter sp.]
MDKGALLIRLGQNIQLLRQRKGMTQVQLAHAIGKDQQSIQRLEAGNINPSYFYLTEIAEGLGIAIEELVKI